jgi:hypothetical protein
MESLIRINNKKMTIHNTGHDITVCNLIRQERQWDDRRTEGDDKRDKEITAVLWIRIQSDPELFEGSGSGINSFGSGSGLIPNFSVKKSHFFNQIAQKIGKFSTYIYVDIKYVFIYM